MHKDDLIRIKSLLMDSLYPVIAEQYDRKVKIKIKYGKLFTYSGACKVIYY